jgi:hypothetical protein
MIQNDVELQVTLERIDRFHKQVAHFRKVVEDPIGYRLMAGAWLAEIDQMNQEVREYLLKHPSEVKAAG